MSEKDRQYNLIQTQNNIENLNLFIDNRPTQVHMRMIDKCCAKSIMGGEEHFASGSGKKISTKDFMKIAENIDMNYVSSVVLADVGDPLLNPDIIKIIQFMNKSYPHLCVNIINNGMALTKKMSEALLEHNISSIIISINSAKKETFKRIMQVDAFEQVSRNIRTFIELRNRKGHGPSLQFACAINRLNIGELPDLVTLAHEVGAKSINLTYCRFYPERIRHLDVKHIEDRLLNTDCLYFHQELSDAVVLKAKSLADQYGIALSHEPLFRENAPAKKCICPYTKLTIGFSGEVYPCDTSVHFKKKVESGQYNFGNAILEPLEKFWNNQYYLDLRLSSQQDELCPMSECENCSNRMSPNDIRYHIMQWDEDQLTRDGEDLFAKGDLKGALEAFSQAVALNPEYAPALNDLGVVHWKSGDKESALASFRKALSLDPGNQDSVLNIGELLISLKKTHEARSVLETYLLNHPASDAVQDMLGKIKTTDPADCTSKKHLSGPMVSVIVPTHNRPGMLKEALESILAQTYPSFEIIVVNDCGKDVGELVQSLDRMNNITYVRHGINRGLAAARNTGIKLARGKYIAYLDDDDIFYPNHLETLVDCLEQSGYQVAYTDAYRAHQIYQDGSYKITDRDIPYSVDFSKDLLLVQNISPVNCFMHTKQCLNEVGLFDEDFHAHEDWELWVRISRKYDFIHIKKTTTEFRWRTDGSTMSSSSRHEFLRTMEEIFKRYRSDAQGKAKVIQLQNEYLKLLRREVAQQQQERTWKCSIIIPVFNKLEFTRKCLEALSANTPGELYEVIIIDNASTDGTAEFLGTLTGDIKIITNKENIGFAKACNQGAEAAQGAYLLFLNNDTEPTAGWLEPLATILDNDSAVAAVGSKLLFPDGTIQHAGVLIVDDNLTGVHIAPWHPFSRQPADIPEVNLATTFQALTAACLLVRKDAFNTVQGFDENYWNGYEDVDLCFKLGMHHWRLVYQPVSVVIHHESQSGPERFKKQEENLELLQERWRGIIKPDIVVYADGRAEFKNDEKMQAYRNHPDHQLSSRPCISIIIPLYNKLDFTMRCLKALMDNTPHELFETIIIDNGSTDETPNFLKNMPFKARVITNKENVGFAKACNQGAKAAQGTYLLFLNNDTEPLKGWLEPLLSILVNDQSVAAAGSKLLFPDGTIQHAGVEIFEDRKLPDLLVARHIYYQHPSDMPEANQLRTYQALTAACLLIRKESYDNVGGFDEGYWNGYEDIDLCFKLQENGYKLVYQPESVVIHYESQSGPERFKKVQHNINRLHNRWLGKIKPDIIINANGTITDIGTDRIRPYLFPPDIKSAKEPGPSKKQADLVSIIILTFNQLRYTKECIKSIEQHTSVPHEIIFVDNGSSDATPDFLREYAKHHDNVVLILNEENRGFAGGNNQGIAQAKGNYILLLNNDVVVTEHWLERLISHMEKHPDIGMVGPMSNSVSGPQQVEKVSYGKNMKAMQKFAQDFAASNSGKMTELMRLVGFCLLIKKAVINGIGGLDENYRSGNFEDDDLCIRSFIAGYRSVMAGDVFVHHYGSMTFKGNAIDYRATMNDNRRYFADKWKDIVEVNGHQYNVRFTRAQQIEKLLVWGEERFSQGNIQSAIDVFKRVLKLDRTNSQALNNLGVIQWQIGDTASAMETFKVVLKLNPDDPDALANLLQAVKGTGRLDLIEKDLLDSLKRAHPMDPDLTVFTERQQETV